ncbi:MAG: YhjD/YihY/BrkB family envelope integrity protein [Sphingomonas sp.]
MVPDRDDPRRIGAAIPIRFTTVRSALDDDFGARVAILPRDAQRLVAGNPDTNLLSDRGGRATLVVSVGITLFSARRAGRSLLHGINLAYRIECERRGLRRQLVSTLLVLGCAALVLTALISLSILALLQSYVPDGLPGARLASTIILFGALTLGAGVVMWLAATMAFRAYVARFARFDDTSGSLSTVVVLMLWLMVSAWSLLLRAWLNADTMRHTGDRIKEREE